MIVSGAGEAPSRTHLKSLCVVLLHAVSEIQYTRDTMSLVVAVIVDMVLYTVKLGRAGSQGLGTAQVMAGTPKWVVST